MHLLVGQQSGRQSVANSPYNHSAPRTEELATTIHETGIPGNGNRDEKGTCEALASVLRDLRPERTSKLRKERGCSCPGLWVQQVWLSMMQ